MDWSMPTSTTSTYYCIVFGWGICFCERWPFVWMKFIHLLPGKQTSNTSILCRYSNDKKEREDAKKTYLNLFIQRRYTHVQLINTPIIRYLQLIISHQQHMGANARVCLCVCVTVQWTWARFGCLDDFFSVRQINYLFGDFFFSFIFCRWLVVVWSTKKR